MQWPVCVTCLLAIVSSVICTNVEKCGINNTVSVTSSQVNECMEKYNSLNISQYFGHPNFVDCGLFFTSQFTQVPVRSWNDSFAECTDITSLSMNIIINPGSGMLHLQSTTCFSSNSTISGVCECRMDCLLEFTPTGGHPFKYFIYLIDIGCDADTLRSALMVYNNASNVNPHIQTKPEDFDCPTPVSSPSISIIPSSSSATFVATSSMPGSPSQSYTTPVPTVTPTNTSDCSQYTISRITGSESYCNSVCLNHSSTYSTLLHKVCTDPSSTSNWFINPAAASTTDFVSFSKCAIATDVAPLKELFRSPSPLCSNTMMVVDWQLSNASCDCGCSSENTPSTSTCVLQFTNRDTNIQDIVVFSSGWGIEERDQLEMLLNSCSVELKLTNCSNTTISPGTTKTGLTFQNIYVQICMGVVAGVLVILILSILIIIVVLMRRRNSHGYHTNEKGNSGFVSPVTITGEPISPHDFTWSRKPSDFHKNGTENAPPPPPPTSSVTPQIDYSKWKRIFSRFVIDSNNIEVMETIGEGAFGLVQKGKLRRKNDRNTLVAIKAMKDASTSEQVEDFVSESAIMLDFDHPNVLRLLGVCFDTPNGLPLIILPYMSNGDLKTFLQGKRRGTPRGSIPSGLSIHLLMRMCLDIAKGMAYLARTKFVHRDLAARNCMVDENLIVQVADFGLSRDVYSKDYYRLERRVKLPVKWLPPESLHDSIFDERTDVWSFGVTCWEVFSLGRTPYPSIDNADVLEYVEKGFRLKKVPLCPKEVYLLLSQCWDESPEVRPCFQLIVESLKEVVSNWESNSSTLKRQMETDLQSALDQEGYESDTLELDATNSMATRVGSRARYPSVTTTSKGRKQSQLSCVSSSSIGMTNINSTTALLPHTVSETTGVGNGNVNLSGSNSEDDCRIQDCNTTRNHEYYNFTPDEFEVCHCCHGNEGSVASLDKLEDSRHILNSSSNSNDRSQTPPSVPIFEVFYNENNNQAGRVHHHSKPNSLRFHERDRLPSQSSCATELTVLPDTPLGSNLYKSMEMEPVDYSLPVRTTPIPPYLTGDMSDVAVPRPLGRKGGPLNASSRSGSSSSASQHPPSTCSSTSASSTGHYDRAATTVTSPLNHFYFTLDPSSRCIQSPPAVFDSDTETPKNSHKTSRFNSTSSETGYHGYVHSLSRYSDYNHSGSDPRDRGYTGYSPGVTSDRLSCTEDELASSINGSSSMHRHMLLEHSGQRFECEYSH